jgi:hypothetical protein
MISDSTGFAELISVPYQVYKCVALLGYLSVVGHVSAAVKHTAARGSFREEL